MTFLQLSAFLPCLILAISPLCKAVNFLPSQRNRKVPKMDPSGPGPPGAYIMASPYPRRRLLIISSSRSLLPSLSLSFSPTYIHQTLLLPTIPFAPTFSLLYCLLILSPPPFYGGPN